jgi:hypothetical protein
MKTLKTGEIAKALATVIKPKEQLSISDEDLIYLSELKSRDMVACHQMSRIPEQNMWLITPVGLRWLRQHNLLEGLLK